jgi:hypothetical protein
MLATNLKRRCAFPLRSQAKLRVMYVEGQTVAKEVSLQAAIHLGRSPPALPST